MAATLPMTFAEAAARQHLYGSYYAVWVVDPAGRRVMYSGYTARKTGQAVLSLVQKRPEVKEFVLSVIDDETTHKVKADGLHFSNGYKVLIGRTIRQEAAEG